MNLVNILNLTRPFVVLDVETTGLDPNVARIVELGFQVFYPPGSCETCRGLGRAFNSMTTDVIDPRCESCNGTGCKAAIEYRTLIQPGVPVPQETTDVHGITEEQLRACRTCGEDQGWHGDLGGPDACSFKHWPTFKQLAPRLAVGFSDCDFAGKNVRFDLRVFSAEFTRAGVEWSIGDARIVDADRLEALLNPRDLSTLYEKYTGEKMKGAHSALDDVKGTVTVLAAQMMAQIVVGETLDVKQLPRDLDALHALQFPGMIDLDGKFAFDKNGVPRFSRWGKHAGKPMKDVPVDYYDFIISGTFSTEVKAIARKAKLGQFPERHR